MPVLAKALLQVKLHSPDDPIEAVVRPTYIDTRVGLLYEMSQREESHSSREGHALSKGV